MSETIEYRVRPVTRYIVTRHYSDSSPWGESGGCEERGEFDNLSIAETVAKALGRQEAETDGIGISVHVTLADETGKSEGRLPSSQRL